MQNNRGQIDKERAALNRWMTKLERSFHTVEKLQTNFARLERKLEQS